MTNEIVYEGWEDITIQDIKKEKRPSKYNAGEYTRVTMMDIYGREIIATGEWTESWQVGDRVEGILQEQVDFKGKEITTSLYLENPNRFIEPNDFVPTELNGPIEEIKIEPNGLVK